MQKKLGQALPTLLDPYDLRYVSDPVTLQRMLRKAGPVVYFEEYGSYGVARYEEVRAVLEDSDNFLSGGGSGLSDIRQPGSWREPSPITESDPPGHDQIRAILQKIITPKIIRGWHDMFRTIAAHIIDRVSEKRHVNGAVDIAENFIMAAFPRLLGVSLNREHVNALGRFRFNGLGPQKELFTRSRERIEEIQEWYAATMQRSAMLEGGFGLDLFEAEDAGLFAPGVASKMVMTFLGGGMETTISAIGSALMHLALDPDLWMRLRRDRSRLKLVFEEAIRLETPIQSFYRTTAREVGIGNVLLPANAKVHLFVGAANRDPRKWTDPDRFSIARSPLGHLAFGRGIHLCFGQNIARQEMESILSAMLDRFERIELVGEPEYREVHHLHILDTLPLRLTPA